MVFETTSNLAVLRTRIGEPQGFTCADGTAILKGQLLKLTDPMTASLSDGANNMIAGIAARDKVASDGRTAIAVFRQGVFDMYCSGSVAIGDPLTSAVTGTYPNYVQSATTLTSGAVLLRTALEAGTNGELIRVQLACGSGGGAL